MVVRSRQARLPRMRQAYPQLDIRKAMSAQSRGETLCLFYEGPIGPAHGLVELGVAPDLSQAWLDGEIAVRSMRGWRGPTSIKLVPNPNPVQRERRAMLCPECGRRCQVLTWIGSWRCRECDGLLDRRQLVSRDTLQAEKLAILKEQLAGGRRKGQHQAQFDRLLAQAEQLARELGGRRPRTPAPEHRIILHWEWMSIAEYYRRPAVQLLPVPSEERWLEELKARQGREARTRAGAGPPAPVAPKASRMSFDPSADRSDDPDEVPADEM